MKNKDTAVKNKYAFSMVELIVAIALISVGLIPVFSIFGSTSSEISATIDEIILTGYANELIDAVINHNYDEIPGGFSSEDISSSNDKFFIGLRSKLSEMKPGYKRGVEIKTEPVNFDPSLFQNLDIYTQEKFNKIKSFKLIKVAIRSLPVSGRPRKLEICAFSTAD